MAQPILIGPNAEQLVATYARYLGDPGSVGQDWKALFDDLADDARSVLERAVERPAGAGNGAAVPIGGPFPAGEGGVRAATVDSIRALMLIRAYRVRGHLEANLDPLGLAPRARHPELDPASYGFTEADWDRPIFIDNVLGFETATLRQIMEALRQIYCGSIGVEFMHIQDPDQKRWIQQRIENRELNRTDFTVPGKRAILERLAAAETFERFLDKKYTGTKRFGLDGGEAMIPALEQILKRGGQLGLREVVIGMPHRGRLNVLANFMGKPFTAIFKEFKGGATSPEDVGGSGDVKYHLGTSADREFDGNPVHLSLTANPSHLEAVDPVVVGKVRAKQAQRQDKDRTEVMALLMHGDAAFSGQGLVPETLDLSELKGYRIGGTIHFIVNNQIGFTTNPVNSRSGPYCSEPAKVIQAPVFHVNGDDAEAVVHVARIATEFRQTFKKDVVIDMFCYRRFGHNEGDEPAFTQPLMYSTIRNHPTTREIYAGKLVAEGVVSDNEAGKLVEEWYERLERDFEAASSYKSNKADWLEGAWAGLSPVKGYDARRGHTAVKEDDLKKVGFKLCEVPAGFNVNRKIARQLEAKRKAIESGEGIDWSTAEALAFGTLALEGYPVRMSGQDSNRGTFSQRHAALIDQETEEAYKPLQNLAPDQAPVEIVDSPLSELAVLGFEYGYSLAEPRALVVWEAQFGDFANGAQTIIDQFIASGEAKWLRMTGLVMLLPHGYEGQGPEHSSARIERFLQLCAQDNLQVVNCTTPANYFHALRRQVHRDFRKPLVVFTPKSLLRHKRCISSLAEMGGDSSFHRVITEDASAAAIRKAKQLVLCSGKVYYDLLEAREEKGIEDIHLMRLEQLYPFPSDTLLSELAKYAHCELVWCQEEPRNMGAWSLISEFLEEIAEEAGVHNPRPRYAGRSAAASPATGLFQRHLDEQAKLVEEALTVGLPRYGRIGYRKAAMNGKTASSDVATPVAAAKAAPASAAPVEVPAKAKAKTPAKAGSKPAGKKASGAASGRGSRKQAAE
ncbi:2-oxoglutarate dehydrogenase E1 component [Tistlia consotensis]|uniref:2-oxoglutarate dehydrogenase E1 component n=1 Tax=Tistlia consotensis USBA 355 TaxID=560819 RepID=A0A1Y6BEG0_9PROT|nr:2-oxoglutarate dehydrogenase E1 component [Tistlia consotensis]SMF07154.1 2-oxoglutarate dehydrogenase E1 component [Tistlia consotensis USBA 355]